MSKNILLGCAAAFVVVGGAQAADLPVKAKPVEYVKICSIYGAGFFYIPGTDTCIKIGGWVRAEYAFQTGNSSIQYNQGTGGRNNRIDSNEYNMRARWVTSIDVRTQTEYGTLRAYSRAGFQTTTGETTQGKIYTERGFIQFAGFTFGKSQSYFDFFGGAFCYGCFYTGSCLVDGFQPPRCSPPTRRRSATASRPRSRWKTSSCAATRSGMPPTTSTNALVIGNMPGPGAAQDSYNVAAINFGDMAATGIPDIVGSLRVEQAWGSAQIAGALHQLRAGYYGNNTTGAGATVAGINNAFMAPERRIRLGRDGGYRHQPAVGEGRQVLRRSRVLRRRRRLLRFGRRHRRQQQQLRPFQRRERDTRLGDRLDLRHAGLDQRRDRSATHPVLLAPRCHRALLDTGFAFVASGAPTPRRTTTTSRRRSSARHRRARSAGLPLRTPR